ncbi:MAG: hypothetical protein Q9179_004183 [Wetmoreana sp. 5 TL-2023]
MVVGRSYVVGRGYELGKLYELGNPELGCVETGELGPVELYCSVAEVVALMDIGELVEAIGWLDPSDELPNAENEGRTCELAGREEPVMLLDDVPEADDTTGPVDD